MGKYDIDIGWDLRPCIISGQRTSRGITELPDDEPALFHCITHRANVIPPSLLKGGHPGGQLAEVYALVEYRDGHLEEVSLDRVQFLDSKEKFEACDWSQGR